MATEAEHRAQVAFGALSPDHERVLRQLRLDGLSLQEVALVMERSSEATRQLFPRALAAFREAYGQPGTGATRSPDRAAE